MQQHAVPALRNLTHLQSDFVSRFVEHGEAYKAAIEAGYGEITARQAGAEILAKPAVALAIARAARQRLARSIPLSISTLEWLRDNSPSHKVRLDAATRLLDRAGIVAPKAPDQPSEFEKPLHEMNLEELRAKLAQHENAVARHENELAHRAIDITPASDPAIELGD
jgi:hypothetical protein